MIPRDDFLTEEEFRYAAECRRLGRLAQRSRTHNPRRIDIAGYRTALDKLEPLRRLFSQPEPRHAKFMARSIHR
jgi:hypothetical protein